MTNEELEAGWRRAHQLLRATEKDRDVWKLTSEKTAAENQSLQKQLSAARGACTLYTAQLQALDARLGQIREQLTATNELAQEA